jgi:hypothetical protein
MADIVFRRDRKINGWTGLLPGKIKKPLVFPEQSADQVYAFMCREYPKIRVGFNSEDMGPHIHRLYGDVLWMKRPGELAA